MKFLLFIKFSHQLLELNTHAQAMTISMFLSDRINSLRIEVSMIIYYGIQKQNHVHSTAYQATKQESLLHALLEHKSPKKVPVMETYKYLGEKTLWNGWVSSSRKDGVEHPYSIIFHGVGLPIPDLEYFLSWEFSKTLSRFSKQIYFQQNTFPDRFLQIGDSRTQ